MTGRLIAMWSGPRNISTALMRSFGNRPDTDVVDEPLYGHYLAATGIDHPGRDEILASMPTDWRAVVASLTRPPAPGRVLYQKHMTHHVTPGMELEWILSLENCFLIREPAQVVRSYREKRAEVDAADLGYEQQARLFDLVVERTGRVPPVIDARDVLANPLGLLTALCARLGLPFREEMLSWPPGPRPTDGIWARHWYDAVERSTGFGSPRPVRAGEPPDHDARILVETCRPHYARLHAHRLNP